MLFKCVSISKGIIPHPTFKSPEKRQLKLWPAPPEALCCEKLTPRSSPPTQCVCVCDRHRS